MAHHSEHAHLCTVSKAKASKRIEWLERDLTGCGWRERERERERREKREERREKREEREREKREERREKREERREKREREREREKRERERGGERFPSAQSWVQPGSEAKISFGDPFPFAPGQEVHPARACVPGVPCPLLEEVRWVASTSMVLRHHSWPWLAQGRGLVLQLPFKMASRSWMHCCRMLCTISLLNKISWECQDPFFLLWTFPSESSRITSTLQVGRLPDAYEKLIHDAGISLNILKCGRVSWLPDTVSIASASWHCVLLTSLYKRFVPLSWTVCNDQKISEVDMPQ